MRFNKLKISADATSKLRYMRNKTQVTPNLLCRMAIMLSLEEGPVATPAPDEQGQEFNAYTLTGEYNGLIAAMLRLVEEDEGGSGKLANDELIDRLRAHIHRGVGTLAVRAKSTADLGRLAIAS